MRSWRRGALVGIVAFVLIIPLFMVYALVSDREPARQFARSGAPAAASRMWSRSPSI